MARPICVVLAMVLALAGAVRADETPLRVEHSPRLPPPEEGVLGTIAYRLTDVEKQVTKDWKEPEYDTGSPGTTLSGEPGRRVAWFGIVREVKENKDQKQTELLVEMKYFDGLTDIHQQIVSIYGAGDFRATVPGMGHKIKRLSLVRVYGATQKTAKDAPPLVSADYVRAWDWGGFAFMDYGEDKSNPKWTAIRKGLDSSDIYSSRPDAKYYKKLLGGQ